VGLHLEHIGEIGPQGELEIKADGPEAVVGDGEPLVEALADDPLDDERERSCLDRAVLGLEAVIR
jgi:hypothetical protein